MSETNVDAVGAAPPMVAGEERVSQLAGDRLCAKCAFNLSGQTIVRERHYGLLIVRCPECGTAAALQEYPLLGRWANRLGYVIAAVWLGLMIGLVVLSALAMWGESNSMLAKLALPYSERMQALWTEHEAELQKKATPAGGVAVVSPWPGYANTAQEKEWWESLDKEATFRSAGGWRTGIAWRGLWEIVSAAIWMVMFGTLMAVCTPHVRSRRRLVIWGLIVVLGGVLVLVDWLGSPGAWGFGYTGYYTGLEAQAALAPYLLPACVLVCAAFYLMGLWWGRNVARWVVRVLLPARMRGPLAFLWIADGKPMAR